MNNKIIGIHKECFRDVYNNGSFLNNTIKEFIQSNNSNKNNESDIKETNINKNQNNATLSRNISFHKNKKKIIYSPKKLLSSAVLKSPKKTKIQAYNPLNDKIKTASTSKKNSKKK